MSVATFVLNCCAPSAAVFALQALGADYGGAATEPKGEAK